MAYTDGRRDTGMGTGRLGAFLSSRGARILIWVLVIALLFGLFYALYSMYSSQEKKLSELDAQRKQLEERVDELSREKTLMESKLKYIESLEGLLQYARENLGYIDPGDTRSLFLRYRIG